MTHDEAKSLLLSHLTPALVYEFKHTDDFWAWLDWACQKAIEVKKEKDAHGE